MVKSKPTSPTSRRQGFTLIELLIVIVLIAILAGLILPAIGGSVTKTRVTGVKSEISQLEAAIASFKSTYGIEPPSSIVLCENSSDWAGNDPNGTSTAIIRQLWPQYDFANHDINGDGLPSSPTSTDGTVITLTVGECLVFFLGGVCGNVTPGSTTAANNLISPGSIGACTGFSKNPVSPFDRGGSRTAPLFDFLPGRFTDLDLDGFPEYKDNLPGQTYPYIYYSSYNGQGYNTSSTFEFTPSPATLTGATLMGVPYYQDLAGNTVWKPNSYQIISPGFDHNYGYGGPYIPNNATPLPNGSLPSIAAGRQYEADNITNFSTGTLQP